MADPVQVSVQIPAGLDQGAVILSEEVTTAIKNASLSIEREAKHLVPVDTGTLRRSLTSTVAPIGGKPTGIVGTALSYAASVEFGSKPHTTPSAPIFRYAERKGGDGWAMWAAIKKHGTKPHPYLVPAFDAKREATIQRIQKGLKAAIERMSAP